MSSLTHECSDLSSKSVSFSQVIDGSILYLEWVYLKQLYTMLYSQLRLRKGLATAMWTAVGKIMKIERPYCPFFIVFWLTPWFTMVYWLDCWYTKTVQLIVDVGSNFIDLWKKRDPLLVTCFKFVTQYN